MTTRKKLLTFALVGDLTVAPTLWARFYNSTFINLKQLTI